MATCDRERASARRYRVAAPTSRRIPLRVASILRWKLFSSIVPLGSWTSVPDHLVENQQIAIVHRAVWWGEAAGDMNRRPQTQLLQLGGTDVLSPHDLRVAPIIRPDLVDVRQLGGRRRAR
jgi:hypothetical protein